MEELTGIAESIRREMDAKNAARDKALVTSREAIRYCANSIRAIHRREFEEAAQLLQQAKDRVRETADELAAFPDIYHAGYVQDAQKEYTEAEAMNAFIRDLPIPGPAELGVEAAPYLNGLGEAVSECRRSVLDIMRKGDINRAEELLKKMDDAYYMLVTFDYPDAITGGLRRTMDQTRAVLERTRGDLTVTIRQSELERALNKAVETFKEGIS
ncbi:MAG: haloacid dehalogenase [Armatimonadota bacterium]|jgi:translin|nr:haloacid dehalogenase [Armatimonadota bacterium]